MNASSTVDGDKIEKLESLMMEGLIDAEQNFKRAMPYLLRLVNEYDFEEYSDYVKYAKLISNFISNTAHYKELERNNKISAVYASGCTVSSIVSTERDEVIKEHFLKANLSYVISEHAFKHLWKATLSLEDAYPKLESLVLDYKQEQYKRLVDLIADWAYVIKWK